MPQPLKDATGPALKEITSIRSSDWVYRFLTNPKFKAKDSLAKVLRAKYETTCIKFPGLTHSEVESLYNYVKNYKQPTEKSRIMVD